MLSSTTNSYNHPTRNSPQPFFAINNSTGSNIQTWDTLRDTHIIYSHKHILQTWHPPAPYIPHTVLTSTSTSTSRYSSNIIRRSINTCASRNIAIASNIRFLTTISHKLFAQVSINRATQPFQCKYNAPECTLVLYFKTVCSLRISYVDRSEAAHLSLIHIWRCRRRG